MTTDREKIKEYINDQITNADFRARGYVFDADNKKMVTRDIFGKLQKYFDNFKRGKKAYRWLTLTGLRGAGKTTIMYQLYKANKCADAYFLVLAVDEIVEMLGSDINEVLSVFEEVINQSLTNLDRPLFLFLDEVQYDKKWGVALKVLYDKSDNIFIFSTGSAAVVMNSNPDIARRTLIEKIYPLSFIEFIKIKQQKEGNRQLGLDIFKSIFTTKSAKEVFDELSLLKKDIDKYYLGINRLEFEKYLHYGSLPFMIALNNDSLIYDQIDKSLERVINKDIFQIDIMTAESVSKIPAILYAVADMDSLNFSTIAEKFGISRPVVTNIFSALERAEVLNRIYPAGSHFKQVTQKPSKYLFTSPAFRAMYYKTIGNTITDQNARGKLIEDLVGMYLKRAFKRNSLFSLTYDSARGGADFIVGTGNKKIVIEVGLNRVKYKQVVKTAKKVKSDYNLIISERLNELEYSDEANTVKIPLKYFLLI